MQIYYYIIFIIALAFCLAKLEIQIEGQAGWAKNLPTWRKTYNIFGWKPEITGYHVWLIILTSIFFQIPLLFYPLSWKIEFIILGGYLLFWLIEDFLWFVLNPAFGIKKFNSQYITWHHGWFLNLPIIYFVFIPIALVFLYVGAVL